jgi:hypothetical protein
VQSARCQAQTQADQGSGDESRDVRRLVATGQRAADQKGQGPDPLLLSRGATLLCEAGTPQPRTWTLRMTPRADTVHLLTVAITHGAASTRQVVD